jgi:hypothetical protein
MEREILISFNWDLSEYPNLKHEKRLLLEDHAEERIFEMRKQGYTSGELHYEDNQISISGNWSLTYKNIQY